MHVGIIHGNQWDRNSGGAIWSRDDFRDGNFDPGGLDEMLLEKMRSEGSPIFQALREITGCDHFAIFTRLYSVSC